MTAYIAATLQNLLMRRAMLPIKHARHSLAPSKPEPLDAAETLPMVFFDERDGDARFLVSQEAQ